MENEIEQIAKHEEDKICQEWTLWKRVHQHQQQQRAKKKNTKTSKQKPNMIQVHIERDEEQMKNA